MAYKTLVLHLLISAPADVPDEDLAVIRKTISQWNLTFGRAVGLTVLPVSWSEHAATEFGERPQEIINGQIVEESDLAIALFYDRLGTPTSEAASGTAEEIKVLVEAGEERWSAREHLREETSYRFCAGGAATVDRVPGKATRERSSLRIRWPRRSYRPHKQLSQSSNRPISAGGGRIQG